MHVDAGAADAESGFSFFMNMSHAADVSRINVP